MPDLPGMPSSIPCATCGFENPTTSLYCQDCGARLVAPPSALDEPAPPTAVPAGSTKVPPGNARILSVNKPNIAAHYIIVTIRTLILAAILAAIILILRAPAGVPREDAALPDATLNDVRTYMQQSAQAGRKVPISWSDAKHQGLNAYLAGVLRPGEGKFLGTVFVRAAAAPAAEPNCFTLFVERKVAGVTLYTTITWRIEARGNGIGLQPTAASLGRLALPAFAAPAVLSMSGNIDQALSTELDLLRGARNVQVTPDQVIVDFGAPHP